MTPGATAQSLTLIVDEQGKYVLDNIYVQTAGGQTFTVGKPGND